MSVTILQGDVTDRMLELPDNSVHCVVTSPPYWGLRDYGVDGQIGLERCLGEHIDRLVDVFREVRRVLRADGTVWLNYGDAYACAPNGRSAAETKKLARDDRTFRDKPVSTVGAIYVHDYEKTPRYGKTENYGATASAHGGRVVGSGGTLKPKDRMLLPPRVAIALQDDGWWIRDEIVWHKPNPMPISVKDRTTPAHEMLYVLSKNPRYYYDQQAIKEPIAEASRKRCAALREAGCADFRNRRSVWTIPPAPFKDAHFATFPPALIEPCILAGCPEGGTVLDPFFGSGTTGLVAQKLGRNCIGIELNPAYVEIARKRIGLPSASETEAFAELVG